MYNIILILFIFFTTVSGKAAKEILDTNIVWINPQFIFGIMLLLLNFFGLKKNSFKEIYYYKENNELKKIIVTLTTFMILAITSFIIAYFTRKDFYLKGIVGLGKSICDILFVYAVVIFQGYDNKIKTIKYVIYIGIFLMIAEVYGVFAYKGYIFAPESLIKYLQQVVPAQQWFSFGNISLIIPKWGVVYTETQNLSFIYFGCMLLTDVYRSFIKDKNKNKLFMVVKVLFILFIIYNCSKIVLLVLMMYFAYCIWKKINKKFEKVSLITSGIMIFIISIFLVNRELNNAKLNGGILAFGLENASSLGERMVHIVYGIRILSDNTLNLLFGVGQRQYGTILMNMNINPRYGVDSNAISIFQLIIDVGLIGVIIFSIFIILQYLLIRKKSKNLAMYIILILICTSTMPDYLSSFFWLLNGIMLSISYNLNIEKKIEKVD